MLSHLPQEFRKKEKKKNKTDSRTFSFRVEQGEVYILTIQQFIAT